MKAFHYTEVPAETYAGMDGITIRWVMGKNVGTPTFTTRVIDVAAGAATAYHQHAWEHEVFCLEGAGLARDAHGEQPIAPGSCVYVEPNEIHQFINNGDVTLRIICVIPNPEEA